MCIFKFWVNWEYPILKIIKIHDVSISPPTSWLKKSKDLNARSGNFNSRRSKSLAIFNQLSKYILLYLYCVGFPFDKVQYLDLNFYIFKYLMHFSI